jgi:hypothetical protein
MIDDFPLVLHVPGRRGIERGFQIWTTHFPSSLSRGCKMILVEYYSIDVLKTNAKDSPECTCSHVAIDAVYALNDTV